MSRGPRRALRAVAFSAVVVVVTAVSLTAWSRMTRVKEPRYSVEVAEGDFEVRAYAPRVIAETLVDGAFGDGGNEAFGRLAGYIFGKNTTQAKIAMTAPVGQRAESRKLAMTAPVGQQRAGRSWRVTFTMPEGETLASLPRPLDERVTLREAPAARFAVVRFSGRWTDERMAERTDALRAWAQGRGLTVVGEPEVNRYDPPWTPWFLRRNEVWLALSPAEAAPPPDSR